jgi:hypothetical protein
MYLYFPVTPRRNWPVAQHMLKMLASWPNALTIIVEHVIANSLELFSGNCRNFVVVVCFLVLLECMDSFYKLLNHRTHKSYTSHFVHLELVLPESGHNFLRHFAADSCLKTELHVTHELLNGICDAKHDEKFINTSRQTLLFMAQTTCRRQLTILSHDAF